MAKERWILCKRRAKDPACMATTSQIESKNYFEGTWNHLKGKLCYIKYYDHVLLKNIKENRDIGPIVRETVGWVQEVSPDPCPYNLKYAGIGALRCSPKRGRRTGFQG